MHFWQVQTLLRGGLHLALEVGLHGGHAGVDQQQRCVILGDQREAGQTQMALALKVAQEHFPQLVYAVRGRIGHC